MCIYTCAHTPAYMFPLLNKALSLRQGQWPCPMFLFFSPFIHFNLMLNLQHNLRLNGCKQRRNFSYTSASRFLYFICWNTGYNRGKRSLLFLKLVPALQILVEIINRAIRRVMEMFCGGISTISALPRFLSRRVLKPGTVPVFILRISHESLFLLSGDSTFE